MRIVLPSGTPAEIATPDPTGAAAGLGLVVGTDIWGLRPLFDEHAARFARELPAVVCVPEPFPGRDDLGTDLDRRQAATAAKRDVDTFRDYAEAVAELRGRGCTRFGLLGFCLGGMYAHKAAPTGLFDRIVSFYGMIRLPADWAAGPDHVEPLAALARGGADRVLAFVGGRDGYTPPEAVADLRAAGVQVVEYPEGEHGFAHDAARPTHRPDDTADAFARAYAWLRSA
jgi:carboxymethylenebutenolidase